MKPIKLTRSLSWIDEYGIEIFIKDLEEDFGNYKKKYNKLQFRDIEISYSDIKILLKDINDFVQNWMYRFSYWEIEILKELKDILPIYPICIDVGAYIGTYSLYLAKRLNASVYAFEPNWNSYKHLCKHISLNKEEENITPVGMALGNRRGHVFTSTPSNHNSGITYTILNTDMPIQNRVIVDKLDNNFSNEEIEFIKIDTEGKETEILYGAENIIKKNLPILLIEVHGKGTRIPKFIRDLNYNYKGIKPNWSTSIRNYILTTDNKEEFKPVSKILFDKEIKNDN